MVLDLLKRIKEEMGFNTDSLRLLIKCGLIMPADTICYLGDIKLK